MLRFFIIANLRLITRKDKSNINQALYFGQICIVMFIILVFILFIIVVILPFFLITIGIIIINIIIITIIIIFSMFVWIGPTDHVTLTCAVGVGHCRWCRVARATQAASSANPQTYSHPKWIHVNPDPHRCHVTRDLQ